MLEQLWLFHCGWIRVPKPAIEAGAAMSFPRMPMLAAVAYHNEYGPILIDAPFGHEGPSNVGAMLGALVRTAGFRFEDEWSIVPRLEQLGFRSAEVHHILMTHLHADHTGGMKELGHARFHIARDEWEFAHSLTPLAALREGYQLDDFRAMRNRVELFDAPAAIGTDTHGRDIFGDGSIHAVGLPGHSVGQVGYRLSFDDGLRVLFIGDAAYCTSQVDERAGLGRLAKSLGYSVEQAEQTLRSLRLYHDAYPDEVLVPSHDFAWGERCLDGPTPLHQLER